MPGNWVFADEDCSQLYAYINYLKNKGTEVPKGDTAAGRIIYMKQACMTCHLMNGHGTGIGPDLSEIGASRNAAYLRQAILDPCLLYTSPSPRDRTRSRMPSSA